MFLQFFLGSFFVNKLIFQQIYFKVFITKTVNTGMCFSRDEGNLQICSLNIHIDSD